jgi:hypothetical protein
MLTARDGTEFPRLDGLRPMQPSINPNGVP